MEIGLITAFLGGTLALLSPCGALLLPAFFASTLGTTSRLVGHAAIFYFGLVVALAPLGLAAGTIGSLLAAHRGTVVTVTAVLLIGLGVLQALGRGFDVAALLPAAQRLPEHAATRRGVVRTFALGAASGLVGVCTGPILGAVLTLAAAQGDAIGAVVLLSVYGAGMVVPLVALAAFWERIGPRGHRRLRGRSVRFGRRAWHTTSLAAGVLLITVGAVFWATDGLVGVPELVPVDVQLRLQELAGAAGTSLDVIAIVLVGIAVLTVWALRRRRRQHPERTGPEPEADAVRPAERHGSGGDA